MIQQISDVQRIAEMVGGKGNHFKFLQAPLSYSKPEILFNKNQEVRFGENRVETFNILDYCKETKINYLGFSPFEGGKLLDVPFSVRIGFRDHPPR
jgi:diketogulonate reductase-like aldo/keto reductase